MSEEAISRTSSSSLSSEAEHTSEIVFYTYKQFGEILADLDQQFNTS
jgi:hypothetical protein